jgi:hypothetical protein
MKMCYIALQKKITSLAYILALRMEAQFVRIQEFVLVFAAVAADLHCTNQKLRPEMSGVGQIRHNVL